MAGGVNPGRVAAGRVLMACDAGRHADLELRRRAPEAPDDRALAWHLVYGVLRHRGELDALIRSVSGRRLKKIDPPALTALRLGLYELRYARTRPHAAVDQAVRLTARLGGARARNFVNAVLRRSQAAEAVAPTATVNHPDWLVDRWTARLGPEGAATWCAANDREAPLSLVARDDPEGVAAALRAGGVSVRPGEAGGEPVPGCWLIDDHRGSPTSLPGFSEGAWWVMDPAAAATADWLQIQPGERALDVCAAPGGKSLRMAAAGAEVVATDRSPERLERLSENAARVGRDGLSIRAAAVDWLEADDDAITSAVGAEPFDAVLVDAPCTGLGTLRRHPEIRWRRLPTDPAAMALRQLPILERAAERVKPGGRLVYAVCSAEPEEGAEVVQAFLEDTAGFTLEAALELAPPSGDEDAFYAARLRRDP